MAETIERGDEAVVRFCCEHYPEEHGGSRSDIFVCMERKALVPLTEIDLSITTRGSRTATQFFCPCCRDIPIKISKSGDSLKCPSCRWDASSIGIMSITDLLQRDADPYPDLTKERNKLILQLEGQANTVEEGFLSGSPIARKASAKRVRSRSHAILPARSGTAVLDNLENVGRDTAVQSFTTNQAHHEKKVFTRFAPTTNSVLWNEEREDPFPSDMSKIDIRDTVPYERATPKQVNIMKDEPSRRKLPLPKVNIPHMKDPKMGEIIYDKQHGWNVARYVNDLIPNVRIYLKDKYVNRESSSTGNYLATVQVQNELDLKLIISFTDEVNRKSFGTMKIEPKQCEVLMIEPFIMTSRHNSGINYKEKVREKVGVLNVSFKYEFDIRIEKSGDRITEKLLESEQLIGHVWQMNLYVRQML